MTGGPQNPGPDAPEFVLLFVLLALLLAAVFGWALLATL